MTESKVDLLAWIRNTPADNGWKAKERDAVANAVAELIEAASDGATALAWDGHTTFAGRLRAALAACTPAKEEGR